MAYMIRRSYITAFSQLGVCVDFRDSRGLYRKKVVQNGPPTTILTTSLVAFTIYDDEVAADGTNLIAYGETLYNPTCPFTCRTIIQRLVLAWHTNSIILKPWHSP